MANTSENKEPEFDPFEQVTPFFNRAQLYAFSRPPSAAAIKKVQAGGSHDYLPHVYIRTLLDRYIGPGMWAVRSTLASTTEEVLDKGNKKNIAITAVVNVDLEILSRSDPEMRLVHSGIGTHTMEAEVTKGKGKTLANAISSAESKGVKAAAQNLGKAFGFDLTNSLDRTALPPSLAEYGRMLVNTHEERQASRPAPRLVHDNEAGGVEIQASKDSADDKPMAQARTPKASAEKQSDTPAQEKPNNQASSQQKSDDAPSEPAKQENAAPAANEQNAPAENSGASADEFKPWELSMDPGSDYNNWVACIRTMQMRINAMTSDKEIKNFLRRHKERVNGLPQIPGKDGAPPRDFKARFNRIVATRYQQLGLDIPTEFQEAAA
ncbi:MAG: hypothetical protein CL472_07975 [Acidobacteria bacterium]|nr:hypothetical protein [Acidobacteriota bacterium]